MGNEDNNRECAKHLMLLTISIYKRYYNCNIFYKKIEELYEPTMQHN